MSVQKPISPDEALRRFLRVIADEADHNQSFRNRLLLAVQTPILIEGQDDIASLQPQELAARYDETTFKRIYTQLKAAGITKVLKNNDLATADDLRFPPRTTAAKKLEMLLDMLWRRAHSRAREEGRI